jgi:hypothetical protein
LAPFKLLWLIASIKTKASKQNLLFSGAEHLRIRWKWRNNEEENGAYNNSEESLDDENPVSSSLANEAILNKVSHHLHPL